MFEYALYIDADRPGGLSCLLEGKTSATVSETPRATQGDEFLLKLYFRRRGSPSEASTPADIAPSAIVFAGKKADNLGATTLLFSTASFVASGEGDDLRYEAVLNLNTPELDAAFGSEKSVAARVDVELQNTDNSRRLTYQFDWIISRQAYAGEASPTPGTPPYPHPSKLVTTGGIVIPIRVGMHIPMNTGLQIGRGRIPAFNLSDT